MRHSTTLQVVHATAAAPAILAFVAAEYDLPAPLSGALLNRGFNDTYAIRTGDGVPLILRLSGHRGRGPADVANETAFLAHLAAAGVPVAAPLPTRAGLLHTAAPLPDGRRPTVLFHHAPGRRPELDSPDDAAAQAITLARLHDAADTDPARAAGPYRCDLEFLLHRPVAAITALPEAAAIAQPLRDLETRLAAAVHTLDPALTRTRCHGDCHGLNARIQGTTATFFDFDDGGFGYLAYDLAVHLWAQISFGRRRQRIWHAFHAAYRATRPIRPADQAAIPLFVAIRHIWLMGAFAERFPEWGTEHISPTWLQRELAFLHAWESDHIDPPLLRPLLRPAAPGTLPP